MIYLQGIPADFPPSKLKQGYGEYVCYILDRLSEEALKATQFQWSRFVIGWKFPKYFLNIYIYYINKYSSPVYPEESQEEETIHEEEETSELKLDQLEDEMSMAVDDNLSDEEDATHYLDLKSADNLVGLEAFLK